MKTVFSNDEIPHLWAHKAQSHAQGAGSISFRDETGYSYAMPICRHATAKDGTSCVLFTIESRSVTTSKHTGQFFRAIPSGIPVYLILDVMANDKAAHAANVKECDARIARVHAQVMKARSGTLKAQHLGHELEREINNRNAYAIAFGVRVKSLDAGQAAQLAQKLHRAAEKACRQSDRLAKKRAQEEAAEHAVNLALWRDGETTYLSRNFGVYLRANGEEMETSQGARVPLTHAHRAIKRVIAVRASGQAWHRNGSTLPVGHYHIDSISKTGDVVAGCHRISWEEIERFAQSQGWLTTSKD
jgi:hypothetical protein